MDNTGGTATANGGSAVGVTAPADLVHVLTRLVSSNQVTCILNNQITSLTDNGGNQVQVTNSQSQILQRGDARADGTINIADALFIAHHQ